MARVLVVDDETDIRDLLEEYLGGHGLEVATAPGAAEARSAVAAARVDLVVLDINMPGEDGLSLARYLREHHCDIAIVMLTSADTVVDRIVGLEVGADDYVSKPFDPRELLARIRSVLRRVQAPVPEGVGTPPVRVGRCQLDLDSQRLTDDANREVKLTALEFDLLNALVAQPNRVLTRDRILDLSQRGDRDPMDRSVDIRVLRLRRKVEPNPEHPQYIRTVRGRGYIFTPSGVRGADD